MIFVTLGTQKFQFNRLLTMIDELIKSGEITDEVFAQIGNSDYTPSFFRYVRFLPKNKFDEYVEKCDLLITHSGVSTIVTGLLLRKKIIVVPRMKKYGEHVDDHQIQIAEIFSEKNYVVMFEEHEKLEDCIFEAKSTNFSVYRSQRALAIRTIEEYLLELNKKNK